MHAGDARSSCASVPAVRHFGEPMNRFRRLRAPLLAAASLAVLVALGLAALPRLRGAGSPPDIVLVVWDTCRGDRVTVNGYSPPTTPRLEELAARGVTFRRCFSPSPWTPPAHASLFTGLLPRRHGLGEGVGDRVKQGLPLLAQTLAARGYETVAIVANPHLSGATGLLAGFSKVVEVRSGKDLPGSAAAVRSAVEAWAAGRPAREDRRPILLFVNLMDTHLPYVFEDGAVAAVRGDGAVNGARRAAREVTADVANNHLYGARRVDDALLRGLDAAYDGAVFLDDRATGGMLDALEGAGILPGALVVVTGDHGENLGQHGELGHTMSVYDPVLHGPLVIAGPGRCAGGRVEEAQVRLQDLHPTLLEAAGAAVPPGTGLDGRSLLETPLLARTLVAEYGPASTWIDLVRARDPDLPVEFLARFHERYRAVREPPDRPGARKLVSVSRPSPDGATRPAREELYDLVEDPGELRDLLRGPMSHADRAALDRLRALDR